MLISFSLENWSSFRNPVTFSMVASRERQHRDRVPRLGKYRTSVLPIAAIYGGNASGKTNFFRALHFAKKLVVWGTHPEGLLSVEPFRLDSKSSDRPTRFRFELLANEILYEYSFAVTRRRVFEEKLVEIASNSESIHYHRRDGEDTYFGKQFAKDNFIQFACQGTRDNQLFLTNSVSQKVEAFKPVYDWFKNSLELIAPDSLFESFEHFIDQKHPLNSVMNEVLVQLDTGIAQLDGEEVPIENIPFINSNLKALLQATVKEESGAQIHNASSKERFVVTRKDDELTVKKLVSCHRKIDGSLARFDMRQESDGTLRMIDLLPALFALVTPGSKKVFIVDEIDRSLHTLLTRSLLEAYLAHCSTETRTQLLFTTHDVLLMDQEFLRRDEMWVAERDTDGVSLLSSFSEYKDVRYDKDIRKSYLQGRLGGIPRILLGGLLSPLCPTEEPGGKD